ncbi:hypothetical protein Taro_010324 [Colocasia esculenta]|uniref:Receptor kinase-like protein Xa21 n=1 Tax=Colocasia esculenta TaxID=4460 RepID=A0A843TYL0_COLES|nr:hypothetical protein [Colocasia esculenta]
MELLPPASCMPLFKLCFWLCCCSWAIFLSLSCTTTARVAAASTTAGYISANETDRLSLLAFRDAVTAGAGDPLGSWNATVHHCQWRGVTCSRRHPGRVTALNLSSFGLSGHISPSVANLTFLREIDLSSNQFYGSIPPQIGALSRLRYLNVRNNTLGGAISSNLSRCSELRSLVFSHNRLTGEIPAALGSLPKLTELRAGFNQISGPIPSSLGNLSSDLFQYLWLRDNALTGGIPSELGRLKNLKLLGLGLNNLSGTIPPSLYNLSNLEEFTVAANGMSGTLAPDLGTVFPKLKLLYVGQNQFQGNIPNSLSNASSLQVIDLSRNLLQGIIPDDLGILQQLDQFNVAVNMLQAREPKHWKFLTSLTNCTQLRLFSIMINDLQGELPSSISNFSTTLQELMVGANQISGSIPPGIGNLVGLTKLVLGGNELVGSIPSTFGKLDNLFMLYLGPNQLSGGIPSELGNLTLLSELYLDHSNLSGTIPASIGRLQQLQRMDLSVNSLEGSMPEALFTSPILLGLDLSSNYLEGSFPSTIGHLRSIFYLNVSANRLSGHLPTTLGDWQSLEVLDLHSNSFGGTIPTSLGSIRGIEVIDLSQNNLTGRIPEFLGDFKYLQNLNLSFNSFTGEVPKGGVFANASAISLLGNKNICGGIPQLQLPTCAYNAEKKLKSSLKVIFPVVIGGLCALLLFLCLLAYLRWTRKSKRGTPAPSSFEVEHKRISYHDLVKATDGFSHDNLIGKGGFGSVYKGILDGGQIIAVKVLNVQRRGASKSFKSECEALRNIRHRNLVKIVSVCSSVDFSGNDFKALVYEFFPNGSLEKWMHIESSEGIRILNFAERLSIAMDVASVLDYLHSHGDSPIVHCDLKPSNILLDDNMMARVGDFGLARFISNDHENQSGTIGIKGSIGYIAPEYGLGSPVSTSGDVYSFGILLLELFTTKSPIDEMFKDGLSLQKSVEAALSDGATHIIHQHLVQLSNVAESHQKAPNNGDSLTRIKGCFVSLMRIGLNCAKDSPRERMTMGDVLKEMRLIQEAFLGVARPTTS